MLSHLRLGDLRLRDRLGEIRLQLGRSGSAAALEEFDIRPVPVPDAVALQDDATGRAYTYGESYRLINRAARMLRDELGVSHGDRVAVLSMNETEYVFLLFACQKLGAILPPPAPEDCVTPLRTPPGAGRPGRG